MTKYIPSFGVEIHAELKTNSKAFSSAKVDFNSPPNTNVDPVDLGYPGSKPTVNIKMVEYAYRIAKILDMKIESKLYFDRKNYFYPDLPKGFQITQYFKPIGRNGKFIITRSDHSKKVILITEIHMEEDTAQQIKTKEGILFDFNRSGVPLIEIVSGHTDFENIDEVILFLKQIREQLIIMGINDGRMEEGSFRVDVNISVRPEEQKELGTKTEVKNVNSFRNIKKAAELEIQRQINILNSNQKVKSTTLRFDTDKETIVPMRTKGTERDYSFIPEGNITPITLKQTTIKTFEDNNDLEIWRIRQILSKRYHKDSIDIILSTKLLFDWVYDLSNPKLFEYLKNNNLLEELKLFMKKENNFSLTKNKFNCTLQTIISFRSEGKINSAKTNDLIKKLLNDELTDELEKIQSLNLMSDSELKEIVLKLIKKNKTEIEIDINNRPEKIQRLLMGQVMKETKGKASPQLAMKLIKEILWAK